jgi:hypothetical protein
MISTGRSRSLTIRRMMASCWKSFSPNTAVPQPLSMKSLSTTVQTPSKWPGRAAPHKVSASAVSVTVTERSGWYIASASGVNTRSTPAARQAARSASSGRG